MLVLSLGTNLGDRIKNLINATQLLIQEFGNVSCASGIYYSEPWGFLEQPYYYNLILAFESSEYNPKELLSITQRIEKDMGRVKVNKWGPRLIDIDLLMLGDTIFFDNELKIPHAEMANRKFVLTPLAQVMPNLWHPVLKKKIVDLLQECRDDSKVEFVAHFDI